MNEYADIDQAIENIVMIAFAEYAKNASFLLLENGGTIKKTLDDLSRRWLSGEIMMERKFAERIGYYG